MKDLIPEDVYRMLVEKGDEFYDKQAAAELLESSQKSFKAQLTIEAKRAESCSMAEAESLALMCSEWREAEQGRIEAKRVAGRARVVYDACKALFDARRSVEATNREVMRAAP